MANYTCKVCRHKKRLEIEDLIRRRTYRNYIYVHYNVTGKSSDLHWLHMQGQFNKPVKKSANRQLYLFEEPAVSSTKDSEDKLDDSGSDDAVDALHD
jgi:sarcosine oxidase delta subunit